MPYYIALGNILLSLVVWGVALVANGIKGLFPALA